MELEEYLLGFLEVLPWALRSDIDPAVGVAGPAVLARIEKVIWVHVSDLLASVLSLAVEPVLGLQDRGELPSAEVVIKSKTEEEGDCEAL